MGIINRFLMFVISLVLAGAAIVVLVLSLGLLGEASWLAMARDLLARQETPVVAAVVAVLCLVMVLRSFLAAGTGSRPPEIVLRTSADGEVSVAVAAIRSLVLETARAIRGISDAEVSIAVPHGKQAKEATAPLSVSLRLVVNDSANVPQVSELAVKKLQEKFAQVLSVDDIPVQVAIGGITNAPVKRERRVV